jgi:hypothetical protein
MEAAIAITFTIVIPIATAVLVGVASVQERQKAFVAQGRPEGMDCPDGSAPAA